MELECFFLEPESREEDESGKDDKEADDEKGAIVKRNLHATNCDNAGVPRDYEVVDMSKEKTLRTVLLKKNGTWRRLRNRMRKA